MRAGTTVAWYQAASFAGAPFLLFCLLCMAPDWLQVESKTAWSQGARGVPGECGEKERRKGKTKTLESNSIKPMMQCFAGN